MTAELPDIGEPYLDRVQMARLEEHMLYCGRLVAAGWSVDYIRAGEDESQSEDARIMLTLPKGHAKIKSSMAKILLQENVLSHEDKLIAGWSVEENPDTADNDTVIRYIGPVGEAYSVGVYLLAGFVELQQPTS